MQRYHRWIFAVAGCAVVVYTLQRLLQAEYTALLMLLTAFVWFSFAYRPPQFRSRFAQWGVYVAAVLVVVATMYQILTFSA